MIKLTTKQNASTQTQARMQADMLKTQLLSYVHEKCTTVLETIYNNLL